MHSSTANCITWEASKPIATPDGGRKQIDADILALTPGDTWQVVGKLPTPLSSPAAAIIDGKLYVAGGSLNGSSVQGKMWMRDAQ